MAVQCDISIQFYNIRFVVFWLSDQVFVYVKMVNYTCGYSDK